MNLLLRYNDVTNSNVNANEMFYLSLLEFPPRKTLRWWMTSRVSFLKIVLCVCVCGFNDFLTRNESLFFNSWLEIVFPTDTNWFGWKRMSGFVQVIISSPWLVLMWFIIFFPRLPSVSLLFPFVCFVHTCYYYWLVSLRRDEVPHESHCIHFVFLWREQSRSASFIRQLCWWWVIHHKNKDNSQHHRQKPLYTLVEAEFMAADGSGSNISTGVCSYAKRMGGGGKNRSKYSYFLHALQRVIKKK